MSGGFLLGLGWEFFLSIFPHSLFPSHFVFGFLEPTSFSILFTLGLPVLGVDVLLFLFLGCEAGLLLL